MDTAIVRIPTAMFAEILEHLLPHDYLHEEAAFLFARVCEERALRLDVTDWFPIPPDGFEFRSRYYLELTDEMRGHLIKRAHDTGTALIEIHSHFGDDPAAFSPSDRHGFEEFVPHILWRLKGRPYSALVVTSDSIDGMLWKTWNAPVSIDSIQVGESRILETTGLSIQNYGDSSGE